MAGELLDLDALRAELPQRFPLLRHPPTVPRPDPRAVVFGLADGMPVTMAERPRFEHAHVIGTTGGGKTNLLEHLVRQDIKRGDGVVLIDPHGNHPDSIYRSLITWLDASGLRAKRAIHLIDPNFTTFTTGFNALALPSPSTEVSVVAGVALEAIERAWGDEDTHGKPTIRRLLKATFAALAELGVTLAEAPLLFDQADEQGLRALALAKLRDRYARAVLSDLDRLAASDRAGLRYRDEIVGPANRLAEFLSSPAIRLMVGQTERVLDLRQCMDDGHVVLVNLSSGDAVGDADAELLGRLLTRMVFFHAKRRSIRRPAWFYLDECGRYLSGDVPALLAEARKFRLGVVLSHQWQAQLGDSESQTLAAVRNATNVKVVFRIKDLEEAKELAGAVMPLDLETPVRALIQPKVVSSRRTLFQSYSEGEQHSYSHAVSIARGESHSVGVTDTTTDSVSDSSTMATIDGFAQTDGLSSQTGASTGTSIGMSGPYGSLNTPTTLTQTMSLGSNQSLGRSSAGSASYGTSRSDGQTVGSSQAHSTSSSHTTSFSEAVTDGETHGTSLTRGMSEGLEPVYELLPGAVHSLENMRYLAAQRLRSLKTGEAYISYAGAEGLAAAQVLVPRVRAVTYSDERYARVRTAILQQSSASMPSSEAESALAEREAWLAAEAHAGAQADLADEPEDFRVPLTPSGSRPSAHGRPKVAAANAVKGDNRQRRRHGRP